MGTLAVGTHQSVGDVLAANVDGHSFIIFNLAGVPVGASVLFEATSDGVTWNPVQAASAPTETLSSTATVAGSYTVAAVGYLQIRARLTAITSGSFQTSVNGETPTVSKSGGEMSASGPGHAGGLVPDPGSVSGTSRFLREDSTWATTPGGGGVMGASGPSHAAGAVPDPGSVAGSTRFLREDSTWAAPPAGGGSSLPANATMRNIATRCATPGFTNTGLTSLFSRTAHINRSDATTGFQPEFANWYATFSGELAGYANFSIVSSLEYPKGTYTRLTFGGVTPYTIPASTNAIADACAAIVPIGARFWINTIVNCPSGIYTTNGPVSDTNVHVSGDQNLASATAIATDYTMQPYAGAGAMTSMYPPVAVWAMSSKESVIVYGDSRAAGLKDQQGGSFNGGYGGYGEITRGFDPYVAYCNVGCPTGTAAGFIAAHTQRAALKAAHTQVHYQYGINDLNSGTTAATLEGYATTIVGYFTGMKVSANTIPPQCTSTDAFATQVNQTQFAGAAQRQLYNTYLRGTTHPFGVVFDISDIGEYHRSGNWLTPDVDPRIIAPITFEGTHWSPWGYLLLQKSGAVDGRVYQAG